MDPKSMGEACSTIHMKIVVVLFVYVGYVRQVKGVALNSIDDRQNLWVTWSKQTGNTDFCIAMASATDPFRTCLIGIPGYDASAFGEFSTGKCKDIDSAAQCALTLINGLNNSLPWDPQELQLLGSQAIGNTSGNWTPTCIQFGTLEYPANAPDVSTKQHSYFPQNGYCGFNDSTTHASIMYPVGDRSKRNPAAGTYLWRNESAYALPPEVFLICADRAWQGIPKGIVGSPCYLGSLTLFAPSYAGLRNIISNTNNREKRSLGLTPDCDDNVQLLSTAARVALAIFVPGPAAGNALRELEKLACWSEKQANVTTRVLESLLLDQNSLRHALLQNRAAIDFLLLAQGHGCEDFEGMCCMNLSDHSQSIHADLEYLKQHTQKIQQQVDPFHDWLSSLGLSGWLLSIVKIVCYVGLVLLLLLFCIPCILQCIKKMISNAMHNLGGFAVGKENGGIVEDWIWPAQGLTGPAHH